MKGTVLGYSVNVNRETHPSFTAEGALFAEFLGTLQVTRCGLKAAGELLPPGGLHGF